VIQRCLSEHTAVCKKVWLVCRHEQEAIVGIQFLKCLLNLRRKRTALVVKLTNPIRQLSPGGKGFDCSLILKVSVKLLACIR
jgi:hypothetical protein